MPLPKPVRPEYSATIPSTGKKIKYNPFSVKEEKVLILASESQDLDEITNAITNVLTSCVTTPNFSVDELALFDIEFLFLRARAKSVGEKLEVRITDPNDDTYTVDHSIDIDKIQVDRNKDHSDTIDLGGGTVLKMGYPDIRFFAEGIDVSTIANRVDVAARCVKQIAVDDEIYNQEDMTLEEAQEWIEGLTSDQFAKVMQFFVTMPRLRHTIKLKNKNTGKDFEIQLEGLADFF